MTGGFTPIMYLIFIFLVIPVGYLLFILLGHLIFNRDEIEATAFVLEVPKLGGLTFKRYKDGHLRCDESECLLKKYTPVIIIKDYKEEANDLYMQIFEYIYTEKETIISSLKKLYNYSEEELKKDFKITHVKTSTYKDLIAYIEELDALRITVMNIEDLKKILNNSYEDDIFIEISSELLGIEGYATAYINCRTKEICYCYDDEF